MSLHSTIGRALGSSDNGGTGMEQQQIDVETFMNRMGRRRFLALGGGTLAAAALAACSSGGGSSDGAVDTTVAASGEPVRGGTLSFTRNFEAQDLNPMGSAENGSIFTRVQIFDTLVRADADTAPEVSPGLAESWTTSEDGLTWTFVLRDATFSNGDPVTSDDVKFSIDRLADPQVNVNIPSLGTGIVSCDVVDPKTVAITLDRQVGAFLTNLSIFPASIVNKKLVEAEGDAHWEKPVGTGPFKLKEWVRGSHLVLERNDGYWEEGLPYLDEVRFDYVADDNARIVRIQSGDAQIVEGVPFSQIGALSGKDGFAVQVDPIVRFEAIWLNHKSGSLGELAVRQALNYAVDKKSISDALYSGVAETANSMIPRATFHDESVPAYDYDLAKAKELMAGSSTPDGFEMSLLYPTGSDTIEQMVTAVQSQWAEIGVKVSLEQIDPGALWPKFEGGEYDACIPLPQFTADMALPDEVALLFFNNDADNALAGFFTNWKIPQALSDTTKEAAFTNDQAKRAELWPQVQRMAMEDAPWVTLFFLPSAHGVSSKVHGFRVLTEGWWDLEDVWLEA